MTSSILVWLEESLHECKIDNNTKKKCIKEGMKSKEHWDWKGDILQYKGRIFLFPHSKLKKLSLRDSHDSPMVEYAWFLKTYQMIKKYLFWERMKKYIKKVVRKC
jgi:hypothetical protein